MRRILITAAVVLFCSAVAGAQTKVTGTAQCGKPDAQHMIPVGDRPDHSLTLDQGKCTYTKPMEIGGDKSKDALNTSTGEFSGDTSKVRGFHIVTMESGDKAFFWYQGTGTPKEGKGNWGLNGGTGKLKGIKGKGTYTCTPSGEEFTCDVEGEYQLAAK